MKIKINELGLIHNLLMNVIEDSLNKWNFDSWCPPTPKPSKGYHLERCLGGAISHLTRVATFIPRNSALYKELYICINNCISARTIICLSTDDERIDQGYQDIYKSFLNFVQYIDSILQRERPVWIKKGGMVMVSPVLDSLYNKDSNVIMVPWVSDDKTTDGIYYDLFQGVREQYS